MKSYKVILSGGGTGGHIYPAISIANEFKSRYPKSKFLFVGAQDRMEMEKIPKAGYKIEGLWISGIQRKAILKNLTFPFKLISSLLKSNKILNRFNPDIAIGTGGFASGPLLQIATYKNIPTLIQEQNSFPGITNKLLAKKVNRICVAYDHLEQFFPQHKMVKTGNPIRQDLLSLAKDSSKAKTFFNLNKKRITLLVLGGSLGAKRINELIAQRIEFFKSHNIQLIWQCGKLYYADYKHHDLNKYVQIYPFLNTMNMAYNAADIIISRAGAISVSELCIVGKPVIFIPSPNVAEDHQTKNAQAVANKGGAIVIKEQDLDIDFENLFLRLINSKQEQETLSNNIKKLALINATKHIVDEVEKLIKS